MGEEGLVDRGEIPIVDVAHRQSNDLGTETAGQQAERKGGGTNGKRGHGTGSGGARHDDTSLYECCLARKDYARPPAGSNPGREVEPKATGS